MTAPTLTPPAPLSSADTADAEAIIRAALQHFGPALTTACSFGGTGGMVLLDMAARIAPTLGISNLDVFVLDTDVLFPETYDTIAAAEARYNITVRRVRSQLTLAEQAALHGDALWERDPNACCALRKVEPMRRAVAGYSAWMTAIRRDQAATRAATQPIAWDDQFNLWKISPLAAWDDSKILNYIFNHDLPTNPLLDEGYTSIGCVHCTAKPTTGARSGRWAGKGKVECGLHLTVKGNTVATAEELKPQMNAENAENAKRK
jgi:phosphoadenosine phosphosulfate reductase